MQDHVDLGVTTPPSEQCAQVGSRDYDYYDRARKEARAYINQLRRTFGEEPDGARFSIKSHPHDFGNYLTVVVYFDSENAAAREYAIRCDDERPKSGMSTPTKNFNKPEGDDPMSEWIDFRELRSHLVFADVLGHYNLKLNVKGEKANGFCPLPTHQGQKRSPSFSADLTRGIWQCFGCHAKGNLLDLCVRLEGLNPLDPKELRQGALKVREIFVVIGASSKRNPAKLPPATTPPSQPVIVNAPMDFELQGLDIEHPYLRDRGFTDETVQHFGLGFCNRGMLKGRVAIPLRDTAGELVGYAGRLTRDDQVSEANPKYKFPGAREHKGTILEFRKSLLLYNCHRIVSPVDHLFVVEGFPAAWWLWQHEYRNVVALMGSDSSAAQGEIIAKLVKPDGRVWIMPDGNDAGVHCARSVFETVGPQRFVRWVKLADNEQPTDFNADELAAVLI